MKRGPKKTPSNVLTMTGNPGKRAINRREPKPSLGTTIPDWLDLIARQEWRRLFPVLERNELVGKEDRVMFALYCETASTIKRSKLILEKAAITVVCGKLYTIPERMVMVARNEDDGVKVPEIDAAVDRIMQEMREILADTKKGKKSGETWYVPCGGVNRTDDEYCAVCGVSLAEEIEQHPGYGLIRYATGAVAQHPAMGNLNQAKKRLEQYAAHFGLSPSARRSLEAPQDGDQMPIQGLEDYKQDRKRNGTNG